MRIGKLKRGWGIPTGINSTTKMGIQKMSLIFVGIGTEKWGWSHGDLTPDEEFPVDISILHQSLPLYIKFASW